MTRQLYAQSGAATSNWRQAVQEVKQEVLQCGGASLPALCNCLDQFPGGSWSDLAMLAQDLALIGQQLHALSHQHTSTGDALQTTQQQHQQPPSLQQQQDQQQAVAPADVLPACICFCKAVTDALAAIPKPHEQPRQHTRWQHPQHHRQQQQQQHVQQHLLPAAAATALCSCLRQWADPMLLPAACQHSTGLQETDLPQAAVVTLGALLPSQLPVISAHERAAVLALLLAIVQPPMHSSTGTSTAGGSSSGSNTMTAAAGPRQHGQEQHHHMQDTQHWALACKAVVALTDTMSEALRSSSAATAASSSSKQASGSGAAAAGLRPEEAASIIAGLVEALSTSCGIRGGSSSRGGSNASSAAAGSHLASGTGSGSTGGSSGGTSVNSSKQQPVEGLVQSQYYASLLVALNHAVNSNKQGWHSHAGAITESARKLFTYGTQQQLQQQGKEVQGSTAASTVPAATAAANSSGSPAAAIGQSTTAASPQPPKKKYVPPHARAAAAAVQSPSKQLQQQQQQWQESSDESEQSASDWSDVSDSEYLQGGSSRRASSSSSRDRNQHKQQQQQQLHDPIKAVRVRNALLQLLQVLIQADPSVLHPYWAALLPSQAPLQQVPLSPHLLTMLLYDPSDKVRLLAAAVLGALLEGPTARSLLAVAEAKTAHPTLRGFTTMSVSLGHMLISLHAGLLAVITAWQQQQQQQQQGVLQVPPVLLTSVLRVLCALVPVTPYERLPSTLLTDVVERVWQLWNVLQPQASAAAAAAAVQLSTALPGANGTAGVGVPRLALSAAAPLAGPAGAEASPGHNSSSNSSAIVAVIAVLAQALSTKKPLPALGRWLSSSSSSSTNSGSNSNTTSSRGSALISGLLAAAGAPDCLLRIEALAALRGCCINYPAAVTALIAHAELQQTVEGERTPDSSSNCHGSSSSGGEQAHCWQQLLGVVGVSVAAAAAQPASARSTPRSSPRVSDAADTPAAAGDGSGSTSPEVKAGQHAVRLLGDWLAAAAAGNGSAAGDASTAVVANGGQQPQQQQQQRQDGVNQLGSQWESVLQLLLSGSVWHHPSPVIRSAAAAVCGMIPAHIWLVVPHALREQLLAAATGTAAGADVTAVRAAACKLLGGCAVMPGVMGQQQQQQCPEQQMLQALTQCVSDEAVSVRLSAAWALANVCDELRQQLETMPVDVARVVGSDQTASDSAANKAQQQQRQQQQQRSVADASGRPIMGPAVLRLLCDAAVAAAGDTEKVRAHGVRAVGALLAAWQMSWGLATRSTTTSSSSSSSAHLSTSPAAAAAGAPEDWSWVPTWFKAAFGALQSCLAARSMKVVWNAACAAAAGLQPQHILAVPVVADSTPGLLRMLVVLVRDSSNYKIKTHAAAALAAPADRAAYGEVFVDVLLVVLAALQGLNSSSSSSSSSSAAPSVGDVGGGAAAAADGQKISAAGGADGLDEEGAFPNYRYIPGLQAQLEVSLCHLLALLQPSDSTRLKEQLRRNQQLLLTALAKCAEAEGVADAGQQQQQQQLQAGSAAAAALRVVGGLGEEGGGSDKQLSGVHGADGSGASLPASRAVECGGSSQQKEGAAGQATMQQQQQVKSALPVDPFGQGARQSADGSAVVTGIRGSAAAGAAGSSASKAAAGVGNESTPGALGWCTAASGVRLDAVGSEGAVDSCGARVGAEQGVADGGVSVSEGVQAALKGLSAVLGPAVVDAWTKQQMQVCQRSCLQ